MEATKQKGLSRFSFGITAAIITSMGIIAGLSYGVASRSSIVAGLIIVAIADNISDTMSIHIYKESEGASRREINTTTYGNFLIRLAVVLTFIGIVVLFPANLAVIFCSVWGMILLACLSYAIAKMKNANLYYEIIGI